MQFVKQAPRAEGLTNALLFVSDRITNFDPSQEQRAANNLQVVRERDLCDRFGLLPA